MPFFKYRARDRQGALVTGSLEAVDVASLEAALDRMGLIPIKVLKAGEKSRGVKLDFLKKLTETVPQEDLIIFSRQLATLFGAGVPLTRALSTLEKQAGNRRFSATIKAIREDVEGGSTFARALASHPQVFSELYSNMVEAGEAGGILDSVLERLALMLEKSAENRSKVKSATLYPKIVIGAIAVAVVILMNFVIPKFARLYAGFKVELPLPTRMLISISNAFADYWYMALLAAAALIAGYKAYTSTEKGKFNRDRIVLKIPVFGTIMQKAILSRFSRVLGSLYKSGLPILQSLDITSRAVENRLVASEIKKIEEEVRAGKPLSKPMTESAHFPPLVVQMVEVGEETGKLDEMLEKVAEYYDRDVDAAIRNLTTTLEPVLLSIIFVMVLFLALSIFLPMWDILKLIRR